MRSFKCCFFTKSEQEKNGAGSVMVPEQTSEATKAFHLKQQQRKKSKTAFEAHPKDNSAEYKRLRQEYLDANAIAWAACRPGK